MFKNIAIKLTVAAGLTSLLTIGIFAYFNIQSQSESLLAEVERHANQLSETVKSSTRYDMLLNQRERIHRAINTIAQQPSIRDVRIFNRFGKIIYSCNKEDIGKMVDRRGESCYACHNENRPLERLPIKARTRIFSPGGDSSRVLGIINPIYNEPSCWTADCHAHAKEQKVLGVLDVTISLDVVDKEISQNAINIAIFAVTAVLCLSIIISFFVHKWVDEPVKALLEATNQVGVGNFNYTIPHVRDDELGDLQRSFNEMTRRLSEARQQIFQSDKMASLGRIAAGVAHEINNPLTGILTYSSFILKRAKDNSELEKDMKVIVRETIRSREIVKGLLDFSRQSAPKKKIADINHIITKSVHVVENQLALKQIEIILNLDTDVPQVVIDSNQITQVIINLLVNAGDAISKEGGTITISASTVRLSPSGVARIKKAVCLNGHSLMDEQVKIDGNSSVKMAFKTSEKSGFIYIDPVYGRHNHTMDLDSVSDKNIQVLCPRCRQSLIQAEKQCPKCDGPVYEFEIPGEGELVGCINRKCNWERWSHIDSAGPREYLEIRIADTGCGIPPENQSQMFEPFFTTKGSDGTGLGLAIIWGIIENHAGTIHAESKINEGSVFIIRLPVEEMRKY